MPCPETRKKAIDFVKAVDAYVSSRFLLKKVSESITDGISVDQNRTSALIRSTDELSAVIRSITGTAPLDVGDKMTFQNIFYDGLQVHAPVEDVRKAVRQALLHPQSFAEYEAACIFYYCSRHGLCIAPAEQNEAESVA